MWTTPVDRVGSELTLLVHDEGARGAKTFTIVRRDIRLHGTDCKPAPTQRTIPRWNGTSVLMRNVVVDEFPHQCSEADSITRSSTADEQ